MYIFDCLYGKIEFNKKITRCILTPEMQRLREVRLGNINSLFLTGSSNNNRFEHCIGTAYLAKVNVENNKKNFKADERNALIYAALFHDLANGPFGHSYEYLVEKQGFIPEESVSSVIFGKMEGAHKKSVTLEPFYMGEPNGIKGLLTNREIEAIDCIIKGNNEHCSKILSDAIDIDNIDNVYRMAYHMGISVNKKIPVELAKGIICNDNRLFFKDSVVPYLYDWYEIRSQVYNMLLYNPEDFSAKCMLAEVMESVLRNKYTKIRWQSTDAELIDTLLNVGEQWDYIDVPLKKIEEKHYEDIYNRLLNGYRVNETLKELGVIVPEIANISVVKEKDRIIINFYNTTYKIYNNFLYKEKKISINYKRIIKRLMLGDLYKCVGIFVTSQTEKANSFSDINVRNRLEVECMQYIKRRVGSDKDLSIAFHAILDKNKTNRQLNVTLETGENFNIGKNSNNLLIGAFIRNTGNGLSRNNMNEEKRKVLSSIINEFFEQNGIKCLEHKLYSEVEYIE